MLARPARAIFLFCLSASGICLYKDAATAQPMLAVNTARPDDLALGLEALHWGMPAAAARQVLPDLVFSPDVATSAEQSYYPTIARQPYKFSGCAFDLMLKFFRDRLDEASLQSTLPVPACRWDAVNQLNTHFGTPTKVLSPPNGVEFEFVNARLSSAVTSVSYFYADGPMSIRFTPVADISGRRAAYERYIKCQSIDVTVDAPVASPGLSVAELIRDPDVSCEYPPVSVRLMEGGTVKLRVHVLADGSVSEAVIVVADRHNRINDAAVQLAKQRLRFKPATQNSGPVESDVALKLVFEVNHPIRGQP